MKSIKYAKNALREAVNYPSLDRQGGIANVRRIVNDVQFWQKLDEMIVIFKPLSLAIFKLEKNLLDFGEGRNIVKMAFAETLIKIELSTFSTSFKEIAKRAIEKRRDFCSNDLDFVYDFLDPRQKGNDLTAMEKAQALKRIDKYKMNPRINISKVDKEVRLWASNGGLFSYDSYPEAWDSLDSNITPKEWWLLYFDKTELSKILSMVLATPLSSAGSERTWSMRGLVHSKSRNR
uniref:HAT C-terminal dimerisation domain-containing protein n=1 Tax=Panagrolaimus davidi TaxID=227884 RepID=A0A914P8F0_9BILA